MRILLPCRSIQGNIFYNGKSYPNVNRNVKSLTKKLNFEHLFKVIYAQANFKDDVNSDLKKKPIYHNEKEDCFMSEIFNCSVTIFIFKPVVLLPKCYVDYQCK